MYKQILNINIHFTSIICQAFSQSKIKSTKQRLIPNMKEKIKTLYDNR